MLADSEADPYERIFLWVVIASCLIHVVLAFIATISPRPHRANAPPDAVAVEILTLEEFEALLDKPAETPTVISESSTEPTEGMIHAMRLYAAAALADPGSRQAREALPTLRENERILQLCNLEAMEQVHRWRAELEPDFVIAYAMADAEITNDDVYADGGAFRSRNRWYNIKFECTVSDDYEKVVDFAFSVGDEIPPSQWESHSLTADTGEND